MKLNGKLKRVKRILILLLMMSLLSITLASCQTSPNVSQEKSEYLVVDYVPELVTFSPSNPELRGILNNQIDLYENIMMHLLSMKVTGVFVSENIDYEIEYCQEILDYLSGITTDAED